MAMPAHTLEWTADMARALPDDGNRYEVLDGALFVTPAPSWRHQRVLGNLLLALADYAKQHCIGWVLFSPSDLEFSPVRLVQPDLFVVPWADRLPADWRDVSTLTLAIEAVEPTTARADRLVKRRLYQDLGFAEYWIVDADARQIQRWRPHDTRPEVLDDAIAWAPREDVPPLTIAFETVFGPEQVEGSSASE